MHSESGACFKEVGFSALLNVCSKHLNCVSAPAPIMHRSMLLASCFRVQQPELYGLALIMKCYNPSADRREACLPGSTS